MINVSVHNSSYEKSLQCKQWLVDREVRVLGYSRQRRSRGFNEVTTLPYVVQGKLDGSDAGSGYDYRFTDDLSELAMLFKLTWGGQ